MPYAVIFVKDNELKTITFFQKREVAEQVAFALLKELKTRLGVVGLINPFTNDDLVTSEDGSSFVQIENQILH